jgi:predicted nucleic acid-binding protein
MPDSAYVDTNILVSYALGENDKRFQTVEPFFNDVYQGKFVLYISHFTLSEALHTLRNIATVEVYRELSERYSQNDLITLVNSSNFRNEVKDRSLKAFKTIIDIITRDPDRFKIVEPEKVYSEKMFVEGLEILSELFGEFRVYRYRCKKCDSYLDCDACGFNCEISYKAINAQDVTHALISSTLECKYFYTMDQYFSRIPKQKVKSEIIVIS